MLAHLSGHYILSIIRSKIPRIKLNLTNKFTLVIESFSYSNLRGVESKSSQRSPADTAYSLRVWDVSTVNIIAVGTREKLFRP
jgi:hypothetical protein